MKRSNKFFQEEIKIGVITLGCPKNTADTESILPLIPSSCELTNVEEASIILLNTCSFLKVARDEVYEILEKYKTKKIILFGCMAGTLKQDFLKTYPQVYAIMSGLNYPKITDIILSVMKDYKVFAVSKESETFVEMNGKLLITGPCFAYIKIAEGCDNQCSFCLIPRLKGSYRSRAFDSIINEAKKLIKNGVKELILVAQDCGLYGIDLTKKKDLADLLEDLARIPGNFWIRVHYIYPERINDKLLKVMSGNSKICHYLDIPLQHGDAEILKAMRRPFDVKHTLDKIDKIRKTMPDITLRTSLIVGFPGETEKQFNQLLKFIELIHFDHVGVFEYSREEGTKAYHLEPQIDPKTKRQRREKAMLLQQEISFKNTRSFIGKKVKVLVESEDKKNQRWSGRSMRFSPDIDGVIFIESKKKLKTNTFYSVKISKAETYDLYGTVIE